MYAIHKKIKVTVTCNLCSFYKSKEEKELDKAKIKLSQLII